MPENDKTNIKEKNCNIHYAYAGQKDRKKKSEMFQETSVEYSNGSKASGEKHPFVE